MITVKKDYKNPPPILKSKGCQKKIKELLVGPIREFDSNYYGHKTVRSSLYKSYHKKCAYCESSSLAVAEFRIDHYRPKGEVKEETPHPGYYWLAYEWSNLLPACDKCNNAKSSFFPIAPDGKRVMKHKFDKDGNLDCLADTMIYRDEKPLLLHPEIDEPEKHIIFLPDGTVKGITERGRKTIEICKLNRVDLILARKKIVDDMVCIIDRILNSYIKSKDAAEIELMLFSKILDQIEFSSCYSRLGWFMFKKFELFFIKPLRKIGIEERLLLEVKKAYETFKDDYC